MVDPPHVDALLILRGANPDMVKGKMGQKVKVKCTINKNREAMEILQIIQANAE